MTQKEADIFKKHFDALDALAKRGVTKEIVETMYFVGDEIVERKEMRNYKTSLHNGFCFCYDGIDYRIHSIEKFGPVLSLETEAYETLIEVHINTIYRCAYCRSIILSDDTRCNSCGAPV